MDNFLLSIMCLIVGYIAGRIDNLYSFLRRESDDSPMLLTSTRDKISKDTRQKVTIDESTYVTDVSTDDLQPMGSTIGNVTQKADGVAEASSKLAQLKRLKG